MNVNANECILTNCQHVTSLGAFGLFLEVSQNSETFFITCNVTRSRVFLSLCNY